MNYLLSIDKQEKNLNQFLYNAFTQGSPVMVTQKDKPLGAFWNKRITINDEAY